MFRNYLKIAVRSLLKRKVFTFINVFGLAIAIAVSLLLFSTALREFSFDNFHENGNALHAIYFFESGPNGVDRSTNLPIPLVPELLEEVAGIEQATRIQNSGANVEIDDQLLSLSVDYVDEGYFEMFDYEVLEGKAGELLSDKSAIVLSERSAKRLFGDHKAVGEMLKLTDSRGTKSYLVSAVVADYPDNSLLRFGALARMENAHGYDTDNWNNYNHSGYVKLSKGSDRESIEEQLQTYTSKQFEEEIADLKRDGGVADARGDVFALRLHPLRTLRFANHIGGVNAINQVFPIVLIAIGLFILAIACINFVNLTLGSSITRSTEVGLRKVFGARRQQLMGQFWGETLLIILIGALFGLMLVQWVLPSYNALFRNNITIGSPYVWSSLLIILFLTGLAAGTYPAWVLSRFQAAQVLKRELRIQKSGWLRNLLVIVQFVLSILLICSTLVINQQIKYLRNKPLGFNKEQVLSIPIGREVEGRKALELLRSKMAAYPEVLSMSACSRNLGLGRDGSTYTSVVGFEQDDRVIDTYWIGVDYDYVETLELELLEGRPFDRQQERISDTTRAVLINESMAKQLGGGAVAGTILQTDPRSEVVGVVRDFNFQPLTQEIESATFAIDAGFDLTYILVKMADHNIPVTMNRLESAWAEIAPRTDFRASFLDENTDRLYVQEDRMSTIFSIGSLLTILLSCLGLFAIAVMTILQRTKEIGIRKVLGASVSNIVRMLSVDILRLVLIAGLIAIPLAWLAMSRWLQDFYYRIDMPWWVFLLGLFLAMFIAFVTVSFQSIRAALANPIKALKHE
ncbi:MAG: ABC transporter permease [Bacteroidota bacterium]